MLCFHRVLSKMVGLLLLLWLPVLGGGAHGGCPVHACASARYLGPPPSAIVDMPPPPRLPSFPTWAGPPCGVQGNRSSSHEGGSLPCHRARHMASLNAGASLESPGWWLVAPSLASSSGDGDKAWPLAVVLVAGSATVLGSVVLLVLSKKKRWQPGRPSSPPSSASSPGHRAGLPAALLPSKGILVGSAAAAGGGGAYDNSAFAENVVVTGGDGGHRASSLLRQLQPPSLGGYRQLPPPPPLRQHQHLASSSAPPQQ